MDKITKKIILNEAVRIGDELLKEAEIDNDGMSWKTMQSTGNHDITWSKTESLYSGVSGISLFLLQLYKSTDEIKYLNAAEEGIRWVDNYCRKRPSMNSAFVTGRMGVSFAMLIFYEATKNRKYLIKALSIAKKCPMPIKGNPCDFINGISGTILALMHLHSISGEDWLLDRIDKCVDLLLIQINPGKKGLFWDRIHSYVTGLCGFSHGAAGVGFVLLEIGHYFSNPAFFWLAEQAFLYESTHFNKTLKNWPDLRKFRDTDKDFKLSKEAFISGNIDFFTETGDMNAWCHGAMGIGLSRIRANELLEKRLYRNDLYSAIEKTVETDVEGKSMINSFILCHGKGGNADLFLESYLHLKDQKLLKYAEVPALKAVKAKREDKVYKSGYGYAGAAGKEDNSLFMGNAGIGYFYLRILNPQNILSVLYPKLNVKLEKKIKQSEYPNIKISLGGLRKRILKKSFKRTLFVAEQIMPNKVRAHLALKSSLRYDLNNEFVKFIKKESENIPIKEKKIISDVLSLEFEKLKIDRSIKSNAYLDMKSIVLKERGKLINELNAAEFLKSKLITDSEIKLFFTKWNWNTSINSKWKNNIKIPDSKWPVLLFPNAYGVAEYSLFPLVYNIIVTFIETKTIKEAIGELLNNLNGELKDSSKNDIIVTFKTQIKQLIDNTILIKSSN